jgi:hypothetical protein
VTGDRLTLRALNRTTLDRQLLLRRSAMPVLDAVEHLVGLQAQIPLNPYLALWSRLARFRPASLSRLLIDRAVVRGVLLRGTIHLVTAADCLWLRPLEQPVLDAELAHHGEHGPALAGLDLAPVLGFARLFLAEPRSGPELRAALQEQFPELDAAALALACRNHLALLQVPPRGVWGESGGIRLVTAEARIGRPLATRPSIDDLVLRYLAAFGPATPADVGAWSRLTGMREVLDRLRPRLRTYRDERDRELFDLPDAPLTEPGHAAPPRFLPEYDNVLLAHADRTRFGTDEHRRRLSAGHRPVHGSVLVDGFLRATWRIEQPDAGETAVLSVDHVDPLTKQATDAITAEGYRMLRFIAADASTHDVRIAPLE